MKNPAFLRKYEFPVNTIGDILKKRRLDLHLLQSDVAELIGVTTDAVTFWENNRATPNIMYYPAIIKFLGFNPYDFPVLTFGDKIKYYRITRGLSQKKLGELLQVDGSTVRDWEENRRLPQKAKLRLLKRYIETVT